MNRSSSTDGDHQPMFWLRDHAIYATHLIVLVFAASLLGTTILMAVNAGLFLNQLTFSSVDVLHGQVWRLVTSGLVNPPRLGFAIDLLMIAWFGRELEKFFGRRTFLGLCGGLYILPPLFFTLLGLWWPTQLAGESIALAVFVAFATLYPNAAMIFNVLAKWAAVLLVGLYTMMALAYHDWTTLISLWVTTGFAYAFVRYQQGHFTLPAISFWRRKPKFRVLPDLKPEQSYSPRAPKEESMAEMDALLDKIARSGMSSLTAKERAKLAKAREELLKKTSGRG